jgi:hypothetical protein
VKPWSLLLGLPLALMAVAPAQVMPTEVRRATLASVVQVLAYTDERSIGFGSGVIVSEFGHVISNWHVIEREGQRSHPHLWVALGDPDRPELAPERFYRALVVGADYDLDLVLLQIVSDGEGQPLPPGLRFPAAPVAPSSSALLGDPIFIFGYPWIAGATVTLTAGTISGFVGENFIDSGRAWIKTDARVQPGNSGGGAFDGQGQLLGIATGLLLSGNQRQEFLRPADLLIEVLTRAIPNFALVVPKAVAATPPPTPTARSPTPSPLPPVPIPAPAPPAIPTERGVQRTTADIHGRLTTASDWYFRGRYAEGHPLTLAVGSEVRIRLSSADFDAYLVVLDPEGQEVVNIDDTAGRGTDVETSLVAHTGGSYLVIATTAFRDQLGRYHLQMETTELQPRNVAAPPPTGGADPGNLSGLWRGELRDASGRAGLTVTIRAFGEVLDGTYRLSYGDLSVVGDFSGLWRDGTAQVLLIPTDPDLCSLVASARWDGFALSGTYEGERCVGAVRGSLRLERY